MSIIIEKLAMYNAYVKTARFETADLMANMVDKGVIPSEQMYGEAEELLDKKREKSLGLRHPLLTGIPTLGIWPLIAQSIAERRITSQMAAKHPEMARQMHDYEDKRYNLQTERDRANAASNTMRAAAVPLAAYMYWKSRD